MRGRSPYNKPSVRKKDAYELLLKLGGEARWKDLEANLKKLGWGPTTLKQTLDQMIKDKNIIKEARLGTKGAEVWYRTITQLDLLKSIIIWKPTLQFKPAEKDASDKLVAYIRENAQKLEGKEKETFLRDYLHRALYVFTMVPHALQFLLALRAAEAHKLTNSEALQTFSLNFDYLVRRDAELLFELLLEYREYSIEVVDQMLREPYKPASVLPRSMKEFLGPEAAAVKWVKSAY